MAELQLVQKPKPTFKDIEQRAAEARELVFQAQSIVDLASSAAIADIQPQNWSMQKALDTASGLLDEAASQLGPGQITAESDETEPVNGVPS